MFRACILLCLFLAASSAWACPATVERVIDGDTVLVRHQNGEIRKIRLFGIDCPEKGQPWGAEAAHEATRLAAGKEAEVTGLYLDRYGRTVALVSLPGGASLQRALLTSGMAWVDDRYCDRGECAGWRLTEQEACRERRGLWSENNPNPPWTWRKNRAQRSVK